MLPHLAKYPTGVANGHHTRRNVLRDDAAGTDNHIVANGDTRHNNNTRTQPAIAADAHRHMYGKNLTFKTGGVDGCDCEETLKLIAEGKLDTEPLITHTYPLAKIDEAYELFENKRDGVIKVAVEC